MFSRLVSKTPEAAFLHVLEEEFKFSQRVSAEVLATRRRRHAETKRNPRPGFRDGGLLRVGPLPLRLQPPERRSACSMRASNCSVVGSV
jgi:hypothetical protein